MNTRASFQNFYKAKLKEFDLFEEEYRNFIMLKKPVRVFGIRVGFSKIMGFVFDKPEETAGGWTGRFCVCAGQSGPVWDLAKTIENYTGAKSEIRTSAEFPSG